MDAEMDEMYPLSQQSPDENRLVVNFHWTLWSKMIFIKFIQLYWKKRKSSRSYWSYCVKKPVLQAFHQAWVYFVSTGRDTARKIRPIGTARGTLPKAPARGTRPEAPARGTRPKAPARGTRPEAPARGTRPEAHQQPRPPSPWISLFWESQQLGELKLVLVGVWDQLPCNLSKDFMLE